VLQDVKACVLEGLRPAGAQGDIVLEHALSARCRGQTNTLDVELRAERFEADTYEAVVFAFEGAYENQFGRGASYSRAGYEIVGLRSIGHGKLKPATAATRGERLQKAGVRQVVFDDPKSPVETTIYRVSYPAVGERAAGSWIIAFPGQSVVAPPGSVAEADEHGNIEIKPTDLADYVSIGKDLGLLRTSIDVTRLIAKCDLAALQQHPRADGIGICAGAASCSARSPPDGGWDAQEPADPPGGAVYKASTVRPPQLSTRGQGRYRARNAHVQGSTAHIQSELNSADLKSISLRKANGGVIGASEDT